MIWADISKTFHGRNIEHFCYTMMENFKKKHVKSVIDIYVLFSGRYETMPIQIYRKFYHQKMKNFR